VSVIFITVCFYVEFEVQDAIGGFGILFFLSIIYDRLLNGLMNDKIRKYKKQVKKLMRNTDS
jgi:hypothetical protein